MSEGLRTFVAVSFDDAVRAELLRAVAGLREAAWAEAVRWVRGESLHLTLHFLGATARGAVPELLTALTAAVAPLAPFEARLVSVGGFPSARRPRVVAARVSEGERLAAVATAVEDAAAACGFAREARRFRPHITLGRVRGRLPAGTRIAAPLAPLALRVDEVVLFESELHPDGARYRPLGVAPLAAGGATGEEGSSPTG